MTQFLRKNAWDSNNGGQFEDQSGKYTNLYWYAKAVQVMQSKPVSDPTSWWFYAAIHGEFLLPESVVAPPYTYLNWGNIAYIPMAANLATLPSKNLVTVFWDQCQHGTWFFLPWHRGYLVALENILRDIIVNQLNGPGDWALPYWNYLNQSTEYIESDIPPAFTVKTLPDGTPNPLFVPERYGLNIEVGNEENSANDECQWDTIYSESSSPSQPGPGDIYGYFYGGGETGFSHSPNTPETGDIEQNPHNFVHGMVGGQSNNGQLGLMGVPETAALDPVFYLHHANIDRMWAAWNETGKNPNPNETNWLKGPTVNGNSQFAMPLDSMGIPWYYTPEDVQTTNLKYNGATYAYTYDDLSLTSFDTTPPIPLVGNIGQRLIKLGVTDLKKSIPMTAKRNSELVGASSGSITLNGSGTSTTIKLNTTAWKSVTKSLLLTSISTNLPDEVYLQLEGVKGGNDANFLSVYINEKFIKSVSLFGILSASMKNNAHGNAGLSFKFNITHIVDDLHLNANINVDSLNVQIKAKKPTTNDDEITIGRVGIYRLNQ